MRLKRFSSLVLVFCILGATPQAANQRAVLTLTVNTAPDGDVMVLLQGDDVLMRGADLRAHGIEKISASPTHTRFGDFISLSALKSILSYKLDADTLTLALTVAPQYLSKSLFDLNGADSGGRAGPKKIGSAFLNYAVTKRLDGAASVSGEYGYSSAIGFLHASYAPNSYGSPLNDVNITRDDVAHARRITFGDAFADGAAYDPLGAQFEIRGITVSRRYDIDQDFLHTSATSVQGIAQTPSTAYIYVNGALVRQVDVPAGGFALNNLPLYDGANNVQVVLRDAYGRSQTIDQSAYQSAVFLKRGLTDYSYSVGFPQSFGGTNFTSTPAFAGRYTIGVTDNVMSSTRLEATHGLLSGGAAVDMKWRLGVLHAGIAASSAAGRRGAASDLSYSFMSHQAYVSAQLQTESAHYANLLLPPQQNRASLRESFSVGTSISPRQALSLSYQNDVPRDARAQPTSLLYAPELAHKVTATDTLSLNRLGTIGVTLGESRWSGSRSPVFGLTYVANVSNGVSVYAGTTHDDGQTTRTMSMEKPVPIGPGIGYSLQANTTNGSSSENVDFQYHAPLGAIEVTDNVIGGQNDSQVSVAGAIAIVNGHAFLSRPIFDSYAFIDVGAPNVETFVNNSPIGRSNSHGYIVAPMLADYRNNEISVNAADTPGNVIIESPEQYLVPRYRSGSYVSFDAHRIQAFVGRLRVARNGRSEAPAYGEFRVAGVRGKAASAIGDDGEFYLENLSPGPYDAAIQYAKGTCTFKLSLPNSPGTLVKLGVMTCNAP